MHRARAAHGVRVVFVPTGTAVWEIIHFRLANTSECLFSLNIYITTLSIE